MKMTEKEFLMNLLSIPSVNGENSENIHDTKTQN